MRIVKKTSQSHMGDPACLPCVPQALRTLAGAIGDIAVPKAISTVAVEGIATGNAGDGRNDSGLYHHYYE